MADRVLIGGEWVTREPDWRSQIDLDTADRPTVYAAGLEDGYHLAISELREFAALLVEHLQAVESLQRAEQWRGRAAS